MDYNKIQEQAQQYVRYFFDTHVNEKLVYHNRYHTEKVVEAATAIAHHYRLNERDLFIVTVAAWFHDIGYLDGGPQGHEAKGAAMAETFLKEVDGEMDPEIILAIRKCILATKLPQSPTSLLESIVCDADLYHLGTDEFFDRNKLMRKEAEAMRGQKISKEAWRVSAIRLLEAHHYQTDYCRVLLNPKKEENLAVLKKKLVEDQAKRIDMPAADRGTDMGGGPNANTNEAGAAVGAMGERPSTMEELRAFGVAGVPQSQPAVNKQGKEKKSGKQAQKIDADIASLLRKHVKDEADDEDDEDDDQQGADKPGKDKKARNKKKKDPGRGIDTVFRITSNNNQRLSTQADSKAHIMIQVNAIIISVLISLLLRKIEDHTNLAIPTIILLTVNLVTIIFSILATRPHIPPGTFTREDLADKKVNLLFFGNFYRMSLEEYAEGMLQMLDDRDFLYGNLIRDVYSQGIALGKKYRWLRISYNVFMFGLVISVFAFVVAVLVYPQAK